MPQVTSGQLVALTSHYQRLVAQLQAGALTREAFDAAVAQVRFQDPANAWWQINPETGGWVRWDGQAWQADDPARLLPPPPPPPDAFDQVAASWQTLQAQLAAGQIAAPAYAAAAANLRVTDGWGRTWALTPDTGAWTVWDGQQWVPAEPPLTCDNGRPAVEPTVFVEVEDTYARAVANFQAGGLDRAAFEALVAGLRVTDEHGVAWQINPETGAWLRWDGRGWHAAQPPREQAASCGPSRQFTQRLGTAVKDEFRATVRSIPRMVFGFLASRAILATISFFVARLLHAYFCGWKNNGIRDDGGTYSPWLYLQGSHHGLSWAAIWGMGGMLFTCLVMTMLRRGPIRGVKSWAMMPVMFWRRLTGNGLMGGGALALGAGVALVVSRLAGFNAPAGYSLGVGMFFAGMGRPGFMVARFVSGVVRRMFGGARQGLPGRVDLSWLRLALVGVSPGFLLAARLGRDRCLPAGVLLIVLGLMLLASRRRGRPSVQAVVGSLACAALGAVAVVMLDVLTSQHVHADDHGRDEFSGDPKDFWKTEGKALTSHSNKPGSAAAGGSVLGGDDGGDDDDDDDDKDKDDPKKYRFSLTLSKYGIDVYNIPRDDLTARVSCTGPDPAVAEALAAQATASIQCGITGTISSWFTSGAAPEGWSTRCWFEVAIPDDPAERRQPKVARMVVTAPTPNGPLTASCSINVIINEGYELTIDPRPATVKALDSATNVYAQVKVTDDALSDEEKLALERQLGAKIQFTLSGDRASWLKNGPGGAGGQVDGVIASAGGQDVSLYAEPPLGDLTASGPFQAALDAKVEVPGKGVLTCTAPISITPAEWFIEAKRLKDAFVLDLKDAAEFSARLIPMDLSKLPQYCADGRNQLNNLLQVRATGANAPYVVISDKPSESGDERVWSVTFGSNFPANLKEVAGTVDVEIFATVMGAAVTQPVAFNLLGRPELKVKESVNLLVASEPYELPVAVINPGETKWELDPPELTGPEGLKCEVKGGPNDWTVVLTVPEKLPEGTAVAKGSLRLNATATGGGEVPPTVDPKTVAITLCQEGLVLLTNPLKIWPDPAKPPAELRAQVMVINAEKQTVEPDAGALELVHFDDFVEANYPRGGEIFTAAGVTFKFDRVEKTVGVWQVKPAVRIPGDSVVVDCTVEAYVGALSGDSARATLALQVPAEPLVVKAPRLITEVINCRKTIEYLPDKLKPRYEQILAEDGAKLGVDGLYELRHEIWRAARDAMLREAQNYLLLDSFLGVCEEACKWVQWLEKLAWSACCQVAFVFPMNLVADQLHNVALSYIEAAAGGKSIDEWLDESLNSFAGQGTNIGIDVVGGLLFNLEQLTILLLKFFPQTPDGRIKAVIAAMGMSWCGMAAFNLHKTKPNGDPFSLTDAVVEATRNLRDQVITCGLANKLRSGHFGLIPSNLPSGKTTEDIDGPGGTKPGAKPGTKPSGPSPCDDLNATMKSQGGKLSREQVTEWLRDPQKMRSLKNSNDPKLQAEFERVRGQMVGEAVQTTKAHIAKEIIKKKFGLTDRQFDARCGLDPDFADMVRWTERSVKFDDYRTPGSGSSVNTDMDARFTVNGKEVPTSTYKKVADAAFADATGFSKQKLRELYAGDPKALGEIEGASTARQQEMWREGHNVEWTDKNHNVSPRDFSDQNGGPPPIKGAKAGTGSLTDPHGLGLTEAYKSNVELGKGRLSEAAAQTTKGLDTLDGVRGGMAKAKGPVQPLPAPFANVAAKLKEIKQRTGFDHRFDGAVSAELNATLKANGFGSLSDFNSAMTDAFNGLRAAR